MRGANFKHNFKTNYCNSKRQCSPVERCHKVFQAASGLRQHGDIFLRAQGQACKVEQLP